MIPKHYQSFTKITSGYFAIFNKKNDTLYPLNSPLKENLKCDSITFNELVKTHSELYGSLNQIPARLVVIDRSYAEDEGIVLVEAFVAQTKTSGYATDFTCLADIATDGLWEWYPSLNYEYMSVRFWSILGYDQKDMAECPSSWTQKIDPEDGKMALENYEQHTTSKGEIPYYSHVKYRHKDGKNIHIVCRGSVIEWLPDGTPWRIIGTHTDVTDIVQKDALESREKFVSRMSHEIRSPLCAVLNECDILGEKYDLSVIKDSCEQILYIANDVLSLNKLKSEAMKKDLEKCDPEDVINKAIKRHRGEYKKKGIRISSSLGDVPPEVLLDRSKFNQIIDNILSNALKYTNKGRVSLDCEYDYSQSMLRVTVEDTGVGIYEDEKHDIFNEFFQGKSSMRGIGVGLHIVKVLCEFLGGHVKVVETTVGKGTTMEFAVIANVVSVEINENDLISTKTLRILVVDDIATNRIYLNRKLRGLEREMGLVVSEVVEAFNGEDAVRIFNKEGNLFDVVLMDCLMPIVDGFEATKLIHNTCDERGISRVPVIAITASVSENINGQCLQAGMSCVMTKPFTTDELRLSFEKTIELQK